MESLDIANYIARGDLYRLLSACYYQPEQTFLEEDVFGQIEKAAAESLPEYASDAAGLGKSFRETGQDALELDYARLFLGPFNILAKPYGSNKYDTIYFDLKARKSDREGLLKVKSFFDDLPK